MRGGEDERSLRVTVCRCASLVAAALGLRVAARRWLPLRVAYVSLLVAYVSLRVAYVSLFVARASRMTFRNAPTRTGC